MTRDVILNICTSMLAVITTQLLAYPYIARQMTSSEYGIFLTVMGIVNLIAVSMGNPLNNTRLLIDGEYSLEDEKGDFNRIVIKLMIISFTLSIFIFNLFQMDKIGILLLSILTVCIIFRSYYSVYFRIKINYVKNFLSTFIGSIGLIIGLIIYVVTGYWQTIFLFSEIFACIYIFIKNPLFSEGIKPTSNYDKVKAKYYYLFGGAFVSSLVTYMDRFFIYPILGSDYVSYYNIASFLGKTVGIVLLPISGVLLTYYAKEKSLSIKNFYKRFILFLFFSVFLYIVLISVGPFILKVLYPTIYIESLKYFKLATMGSILFILGNTIQPTLLRYGADKWQTIVQVVYLCVYVALSMILMTIFGLYGFCVAIIVANIFKIVFMIVIINKSIGE